MAGFGLRVMPSGVKSFIVRYRADGGGRTAKRRTYTLGRFGALTLDQARKSAKSVLGAVANGQDPGEKRIAKRGKMLISRSEEHTSELQSLMRISYAVCCLKKK